MIMSDFYIQQIFAMITCGCRKDSYVAIGCHDKGGTCSAVQPNIDSDQWNKNFITHAYPQLHIRDYSTTLE